MRYRRVLSIWRRLELWLGMLSEPGGGPPPADTNILCEDTSPLLTEGGANIVTEV